MTVHGADDLAGLIRARVTTRPLIIAIDGRSGTGKSTLAARLAGALDATVIDGDDFFAGGVEVRTDAPADRARDCIDWRRQRPVLEALRAGEVARYHAFDWDAFDGSLEAEATEHAPRPIILFEGVYTARPELSDLLDLRVLVEVPDDVRLARLRSREGAIGPWERQWHEAELWYFAHAAPPPGFDVIVES